MHVIHNVKMEADALETTGVPVHTGTQDRSVRTVGSFPYFWYRIHVEWNEVFLLLYSIMFVDGYSVLTD